MRALTAIVMGAGLLLLPGAASAQTRCPDMRTASGECVDPSVSEAARKTVLYMTQPKFSYTAPPWLPYEDRDNFTARDHHEISNLFTFPPPGFTAPKP
jgi:hypothetical protein